RHARNVTMAWLTVAIEIDREDEDAFWAEFDEDRMTAALPGTHAHLIWAGDPPVVEFAVEADSAEALRAAFDTGALIGSLPDGSRPRLLSITSTPQRPTVRINSAWRRRRRP
ncbi:MAG: hypothetical protein WKF48_13745, partial [Solirubrobacteraceae bacterium]